jgi:hypothetical protein
MTTTPHAQVQYINPVALHKNPAFTHMVTVSGPVKTVYIGAQVSVDTDEIDRPHQDLQAIHVP